MNSAQLPASSAGLVAKQPVRFSPKKKNQQKQPFAPYRAQPHKTPRRTRKSRRFVHKIFNHRNRAHRKRKKGVYSQNQIVILRPTNAGIAQLVEQLTCNQ
jgi:hypothetical protein